MFLPLARGDVLVHVAVEQQEAHLVVVVDGGEGHQGGKLHRRLALGAVRRAEVERGAHVHQQQHRELALLDIALDERRADAGGDVPVDGAHIVARKVGPYFVEFHAPTPEH